MLRKVVLQCESAQHFFVILPLPPWRNRIPAIMLEACRMT